ncbi:hypothetical protein K432DRAFT_4615 [Lepidopterella palustris CBS 459.81]|uniref:Uncharacterized protein n=1 Tax=Lepidopterella palustris CBS 459.81 TaxID=1314670 RepID=A0A8E2JGV0_9PEZI|nr:hypothetical protein K432DRAFT_4615 [Lepidopterella palustris CBS 459.81]
MQISLQPSNLPFLLETHAPDKPPENEGIAGFLFISSVTPKRSRMSETLPFESQRGDVHHTSSKPQQLPVPPIPPTLRPSFAKQIRERAKPAERSRYTGKRDLRQAVHLQFYHLHSFPLPSLLYRCPKPSTMPSWPNYTLPPTFFAESV